MATLNLSIVTFNLGLVPFRRHPYLRVRLFARQLNGVNTDIINLQEVHTYDSLWLLRRYLAKNFPFVCYKPGIYGPKAGLVTFSKEPLHMKEFVPLSVNKGVLISELDGGLLVANAHLIANKAGDWSRTSRYYPLHEAQLDHMNEFFSGPDYTTCNIILTGDFNVAKSSDLYEYFTKGSSWYDAFRQDVTPTFHGEFLPSDRTPQCIDYIFTRGNIEVKKAARAFEDEVEDTYVSDHIGLYVTVSSGLSRE